MRNVRQRERSTIQDLNVKGRNETTTLVHIKNKPERFKMNDREEMNRNV
jgi:hypothetical protein